MTGLPPAVDPRRVLEEVRWRRDQFLSLLEALCRQESPSLDPGGQQAVHTVLAANLDALGFEVRELPGPRSGGHLYARPRRRTRGAPLQLLLGHYDTVWPSGTLASMPFAVEGDRVRGPGVYDMKGGLAQMVVALATLRGLGLEPSATPVVLVNADEEVGSRESGRHVRRLARAACRAFWSDHPLNLAFRHQHGSDNFTLKAFVQFVVAMPPGQFAACMLEVLR